MPFLTASSFIIFITHKISSSVSPFVFKYSAAVYSRVIFANHHLSPNKSQSRLQNEDDPAKKNRTTYFVLSQDMLIKIAEYFGVTTDFLLGLSENHTLNTTGLSETQIAHIQTLIDDIRGK